LVDCFWVACSGIGGFGCARARRHRFAAAEFDAAPEPSFAASAVCRSGEQARASQRSRGDAARPRGNEDRTGRRRYKPQPRGKAIYQRRNRNLIFFASNLPPLPPEKIYELWLFPANGGAPIAAGLFKPDAR